MLVEGGDYSALKRFETTVSDYKRRFLKPGARDDFFDVGLLMREDFRFSDQREYGLEVADILVNAVRRSLAGNFSRPGWLALPQLMVHRRQHYVQLISLGRAELDGTKLPYKKVINDFRTGGRSMLPSRQYRLE